VIRIHFHLALSSLEALTKQEFCDTGSQLAVVRARGSSIYIPRELKLGLLKAVLQLLCQLRWAVQASAKCVVVPGIFGICLLVFTKLNPKTTAVLFRVWLEANTDVCLV